MPLITADRLDLPVLKPLILFIILAGLFTRAFAQERQVEGIVYDRDTKQRISRVYIFNIRSGKGLYDNIKGEFTVTASRGDTLMAVVHGYAIDTLVFHNQKAIVFYLRRTSIQLREVTVTDTIHNPKNQLERIKREYKDAYRKGNPQEFLQKGGSNGTGGAGLGIDALYGLLSREGKNARYLQEIIERDYKENIVSYRYTPTLVKNITGLSGDELDDFMQQYRPSYFFIVNASDYELINFVRQCYIKYIKNPDANRLPSLKP